MGRAVNQPKKYIVSCRINGNEMETLNKIAQEAGTNISDLLRQSIFRLEQDLRASHRRPFLGAPAPFPTPSAQPFPLTYPAVLLVCET